MQFVVIYVCAALAAGATCGADNAIATYKQPVAVTAEQCARVVHRLPYIAMRSHARVAHLPLNGNEVFVADCVAK